MLLQEFIYIRAGAADIAAAAAEIKDKCRGVSVLCGGLDAVELIGLVGVLIVHAGPRIAAADAHLAVDRREILGLAQVNRSRNRCCGIHSAAQGLLCALSRIAEIFGFIERIAHAVVAAVEDRSCRDIGSGCCGCSHAAQDRHCQERRDCGD